MTLKFKFEVSLLSSVLVSFILLSNHTISKFSFLCIVISSFLYFFPYNIFNNLKKDTYKYSVFLQVMIPVCILFSYLSLHFGLNTLLLSTLILLFIFFLYLLLTFGKNIIKYGSDFVLSSLCILILTCVVAYHII